MFTDDDVRRTVGLRDATSAVFVKQYGEKRSGTNAIRALIMENYDNVFVLMNILGDKHGVPVDLPRLSENVAGEADAAWQFVTSATAAIPAETTKPGDYQQLRFLRALHEPIAAAYRERRFHYLISVRNPYQWAGGLLKYCNWPDPRTLAAAEHRTAEEFLKFACGRFNEKHRAWVTLHRAHPGQATIVQNERLATEFADVLINLERRLSLTRRRPELVPITRPVMPTNWDYDRSAPSEHWFPRSPSKPPLELTPVLHDLVTNEIDWTLMRAFGYGPAEFRATGRAARERRTA